ncbi:MAG: hypothetical protein IJ458_03930 [Clostridia bacterium]|nr:hypothetical protein [Clostridia bacterium]
MRITQSDRSTPESVFWTNFIVGTVFSFMAILISLFTTYSQECKNKLKWIGALFGAIGSIFIMGSVAFLCRVAENPINIMWMTLLFICGIMYIFVIKKNINKIYDLAGYYPSNFDKMIKGVVKETSNKDYQLRYNIEYGALRSLTLQMPNKFKEELINNNDELIDFLYELYKDMQTPISKEDFGIYGRSNGDEYNVVIKLPQTTATGLCNMIGIKVNQKRFFALTTSNLIEWNGLENPTRSYYVYNGETKDDLLHFLEREDIK